MLVSVFTAPKYFVNKRPFGTCGRVCEKQIQSEYKLTSILEKSHKFDQIKNKMVNLRIVVPPVTNRASSLNSFQSRRAM